MKKDWFDEAGDLVKPLACAGYEHKGVLDDYVQKDALPVIKKMSRDELEKIAMFTVVVGVRGIKEKFDENQSHRSHRN